jgi:hypothetical protein
MSSCDHILFRTAPSVVRRLGEIAIRVKLSLHPGNGFVPGMRQTIEFAISFLNRGVRSEDQAALYRSVRTNLRGGASSVESKMRKIGKVRKKTRFVQICWGSRHVLRQNHSFRKSREEILVAAPKE